MKPAVQEHQYHNTKAAAYWIEYLRKVMPQINTFTLVVTILNDPWFTLENVGVRRIVCVSCGGEVTLRDFKYGSNAPDAVRCFTCQTEN
jgi:DNA-directed RNA polymerase subunit N (RpoN/RPB10)